MTQFLRKIVWTPVAFLLISAPLMAQNLDNYLSGPHYNLNIIGVDNPKTSTMTTSNRHTIFVGLGSKNNPITTNIWLSPGLEFRVCDGNGFDPAHDCAGVPFKPEGATFQLPCNTSLTYDPLLGCPAEVAQRSYTIWARALGKPGGKADAMTCATDLSTNEVICSTTNVLTLDRQKGKSAWQDATKQLTSLVADLDGDGDLETVALFADGFQDFFWQWNSQGLKLAQLRFYSYPVASINIRVPTESAPFNRRYFTNVQTQIPDRVDGASRFFVGGDPRTLPKPLFAG